jgi:hypothetical protein
MAWRLLYSYEARRVPGSPGLGLCDRRSEKQLMGLRNFNATERPGGVAPWRRTDSRAARCTGPLQIAALGGHAGAEAPRGTSLQDSGRGCHELSRCLMPSPRPGPGKLPPTPRWQVL